MSKARVQQTSIQQFTYELPDERIAKYPVEPRDSSKLLVFRDGVIQDKQYTELAEEIPSGSFLVMNNTKVVEARLLFTKSTGGKIEVFCLEPSEMYAEIQSAMLQKDRVLWKCLVGGAKKWKEPILTMSFQAGKESFTLSASIAERRGDHYLIDFSWDKPHTSFAEVLHLAGVIPLPPYLNRESEEADETRYQTIYARHDGSVAAPTAGLHFTDRVLNSLAKKDIIHDFVTLHVGAGTFAPVKSEKLADHPMHAEFIDVSLMFLNHWLERMDAPLIPVGTTSLRTLESLYWIGVKCLEKQPLNWEDVGLTQWEAYELPQQVSVRDAITALIHELKSKGMDRLITKTQLLIGPGYAIRTAAGILTNFHQPQSTLLLLIHAFVGESWKTIYEHALKNDYRFLSFGDGSLLWKNAE
ncbi:MAG: S-adenosylmethionine:tRNA ribosyltransferase-isomerase [Fluviicola sp.]